MRIKLKRDTRCAYDEHEMTMYPREGFIPKPVLPAGTVLNVDKKWMNFYGTYYRCGEYDIPTDAAVVIEGGEEFEEKRSVYELLFGISMHDKLSGRGKEEAR